VRAVEAAPVQDGSGSFLRLALSRKACFPSQVDRQSTHRCVGRRSQSRDLRTEPLHSIPYSQRAHSDQHDTDHGKTGAFVVLWSTMIQGDLQ